MGRFVLFARYARGLVVVVDDTVTFDDDDDNGADEGDVYDDAVTVAIFVFVVFWTTEDDVWTSTSLLSVSPIAIAATDVFEGCFWWEIWWWWYGYE